MSFAKDRRRLAVCLLVAVGVAVLAAATAGSAAPHRAAAARRLTALAALAKLPVKGRAPKTGYSRDQFGDGWASVDGCDERDRILQRDLTHKRIGSDGCRVLSGVLRDPYTGRTVRYVRGASEVDVDHVVALSDAWQKGAQRWSRYRRESFANDPLELIAVDASVNRAKGDGDAATWLPPRKAFRCAYVARQVAVKRRFGLWVTAAERNAIRRVLARCPNQRLPTGGLVPVFSTPAQPPVSKPPMSKPSPSKPAHVRVFQNCTEVRAAGLAPILRGTALYNANRKLDRDGDGVACEE